jgi:hypothetical protein
MNDVQMKIRLPAALKERIEASARAGNRSLNGEILLRLDLSFAEDDDTEKRFAELKASLMSEVDNLRDQVRHQGMRLQALETKTG